MRRESKVSPVKAIFLSVLMVMMVQTGYMDIWNNSVSNDSTLDESTSSQSGGGNSLIPSSDGADLMLGEVMDNITFQFDYIVSTSYEISNPSWTASDIATTADGAYDVHVADMDGDGDLDIVSASWLDSTVAWYENDGAADPSWTATDITTSAAGVHSVFVGDMDGDGDLDIVSGDYNDATIAWYENDGAADPSWTAADIDGNATGVRSVHVADMDGDGDLDILSASALDNTIAWYENDGAANPSWTATDINTSASHAYEVYAADMDDDGDLDIFSASWG